MTCQHGMIIKAINRNLNNVKVNSDSGDRVVSVNLTQGRCNKGWNPSHITYDNMLGAWFYDERNEDDMKRTLE